jgi:hypothetical protein
MFRDPYTVLGLSQTASKDDAKKAYRKKAMEFHPDRHQGVAAQKRAEEAFKEAKDAWESIERGWKAPTPEPAYTSSFTDPKPRNKKTTWGFKTDVPPTAGKAAPGYEARGVPPPMPRSSKSHVTLEITQQQAFEGCVVPFVHEGRILNFEVRPGSAEFSNREELFANDEIIGHMFGRPTKVKVSLRIVAKQAPKSDPPPKEAPVSNTIDLKLCALGLFIGGKITVRDYRDQPVHITIPPGYNPAEPIVVKGRGHDGADLIVKIEPVFKVPSALNSNELRQLQRLNEMTS